MIFKDIVSLQIKTKQNFQDNLARVITEIRNSQKGSIILTPELVFSGFCYQNMNEASEFSKHATEQLLNASANHTIITTMIEKKNHKFYNNLKVFSQGELIHKQAKHQLFMLGEEHLHFAAGSINEIIPFRLDGINCGALICFELRFVELWQRLSGVDVLFIPAQWGQARKDHFETLCKALAIANQCFVVASNSASIHMAKSSAIISPYGKVIQDDAKEIIQAQIDVAEVEKMRKYINVGLKECIR